jgi:phosphatidylglycerol lysyltransferase
MLLIVARSLWRRQEAAYFVTLALLTVGAGLELYRGFGLVTAIPLLVAALVLAPCRFAFDVRSRLTRDAVSAGWAVATGMAGLSAVVLSVLAHQDSALADEPWWAFVAESRTTGAISVAAGLAALALFVAAWELLGSSHRQRKTARRRPSSRARRQDRTGSRSPRRQGPSL